ncbi:hypothetical protein TIFTF001_011168 [Ficus carica]|uniref:Uncharacterized protein n=1 Tax=Ficus carica TaxID=3494 RepID=A0AA87ZXR6_FICCA|nr:hypothetical protein TIFTF001_011168 [Ficus carica]
MGLLFISAVSELTLARASSTVHLFRFAIHRLPCGGVSLAFASELEPISDHLQVNRRSIDCFDSLSISDAAPVEILAPTTNPWADYPLLPSTKIFPDTH